MLGLKNNDQICSNDARRGLGGVQGQGRGQRVMGIGAFNDYIRLATLTRLGYAILSESISGKNVKLCRHVVVVDALYIMIKAILPEELLYGPTKQN